jgi:N-acetylglutamate synthase-like GNAT family acetyltransferase
MNIRSAQTTDARAIAELLCNIDDHPHWKERGVDELEQTVRNGLEWNNPERLVLVVELEDRVVGYGVIYWQQLLFSRKEAYISELFIHSDTSSKGVGTALLRRMESEAVAQNCRRLTLVNFKDVESYRRGFYSSRGWTEQENTVRFALNLEVKA